MDGTANFYSTTVLRGNHYAIIFISPSITEALNNAGQIHLDATFKIVPQLPRGMKKLMTLSVLAYDQVILLISI